MSKTDAGRWNDWRVSQRQPLIAVSRCGCGAEFIPGVRGQVTCRPCCGIAEAEDRAPTTADQIQREALDRQLLAALADQAQHQPIELAAAPSDQEKLWQKSKRHSAGQHRHHRAAGKSSRGMNDKNAKVALKRLRSGMSIQKVSKMLGINEQLIRDHAIMTVEDARYRAACDGKIGPRAEPLASEPAGNAEVDICQAGVEVFGLSFDDVHRGANLAP